MMRPYVVCFAIVACSLVSCVPSLRYHQRTSSHTTLDEKTIRVLIATTRNHLEVSSKGNLRIYDLKTKELLYKHSNNHIEFSAENIENPLFIESLNDTMQVNDVSYKGSIEIHNVLGAINVINIVTLHDYLCSVVPGEIPANWPIEALKAQAVAARTYAYYHIVQSKNRKFYDLDSTMSFQVYKGVSSEKDSTTQAVLLTEGEMITCNKEPILAYFHSTCGGRTANDRDLWKGSDHPYLRSVSCNYCKESPHYKWEFSIALADIRKLIQKQNRLAGSIRSIKFMKRSGRITDVAIRHTLGILNLTGNQFRILLSPDRLKSTWFYTKKQEHGIHFDGKGWGHGVGMCQWGAKGMAERGYSYKKVLHYYYHNATIEKM